GLVDCGNRHWRVLEETHETHFRGALGITTFSSRSIESKRARSTGGAVRTKRNFVKQSHGYRLAAPRLEVEIEDLGPDLSRRSVQCGQQRSTLSCDDVTKLQRACSDLGQIVIEPGCECRVQIDNVAGGIDRKKSGRCVIEVVDRVLKLLEYI